MTKPTKYNRICSKDSAHDTSCLSSGKCPICQSTIKYECDQCGQYHSKPAAHRRHCQFNNHRENSTSPPSTRKPESNVSVTMEKESSTSTFPPRLQQKEKDRDQETKQDSQRYNRSIRSSLLPPPSFPPRLEPRIPQCHNQLLQLDPSFPWNTAIDLLNPPSFEFEYNCNTNNIDINNSNNNNNNNNNNNKSTKHKHNKIPFSVESMQNVICRHRFSHKNTNNILRKYPEDYELEIEETTVHRNIVVVFDRNIGNSISEEMIAFDASPFITVDLSATHNSSFYSDILEKGFIGYTEEPLPELLNLDDPANPINITLIFNEKCRRAFDFASQLSNVRYKEKGNAYVLRGMICVIDNWNQPVSNNNITSGDNDNSDDEKLKLKDDNNISGEEIIEFMSSFSNHLTEKLILVSNDQDSIVTYDKKSNTFIQQVTPFSCTDMIQSFIERYCVIWDEPPALADPRSANIESRHTRCQLQLISALRCHEIYVWSHFMFSGNDASSKSASILSSSSASSLSSSSPLTPSLSFPSLSSSSFSSLASESARSSLLSPPIMNYTNFNQPNNPNFPFSFQNVLEFLFPRRQSLSSQQRFRREYDQRKAHSKARWQSTPMIPHRDSNHIRTDIFGAVISDIAKPASMLACALDHLMPFFRGGASTYENLFYINAQANSSLSDKIKTIIPQTSIPVPVTVDAFIRTGLLGHYFRAPWEQMFFGSHGVIGNLGFCDFKVSSNVAFKQVNFYGKTWTSHSSVLLRQNHTAVIVDGDTYVFGGVDTSQGNCMSDLVLISGLKRATQAKPIRSTKGGVPCSRMGHAAISMDGQMFIFGGEDEDQNNLNDLWSLEPESMTWNTVELNGRKPLPRAFHSMVTDEESRIIIFGGENNGRFLNDTIIINMDEDSLIQGKSKVIKTSPIPARSHHASVWLDDMLWVFGGQNHETYLNDLWRFDLENEIWEKIRICGEAIPTPRSRMSYCCIETLQEDHVFAIVGGGNENGRLSSVWICSVQPERGTATWREAILNDNTEILTLRENHASLWQGDVMYLIGGNINTYSTKASFARLLWHGMKQN